MDSRPGALPLVLLVTLAACEGTPETVTAPDPLSVPPPSAQLAMDAASPVYQVMGSGSVVREDIEGSPREIYGFNASLGVDGRATGQAEIHFPSDDLRMHIAVRCLVVREGEAWMSGPVTRSDRADIDVGTVYVWRVQDNGGGRGAPPDRISNFVRRGTGNFHAKVCIKQWGLDTYPWDNGDVRILATGTDLTQQDLAGTWDATTFVYTDVQRPGWSQDQLGGMGLRVRLTVAPDGRFSMVWWEPGTMFENTHGVMEALGGQVLAVESDDPTPATVTAGRFGRTLWFDAFETTTDIDGDGDEEPARLFAAFRLKKRGTLVGDLVGVWEAEAYRYTSVADPGVFVDLIDGGLTFTLTVGPDSRYTAVVNGDEDSEDFIVEGSEFLTRDVSLTFTLEGDQLTLTGPTDFDFPGDPEGSEAAILELVLVR